MKESSTNSPSALSKRAECFLSGLHRHQFVPTADVQAALQKEGLPVYESWLRFHEHYAGYESNLGLDGMIWGLLHTQYRYANPEITPVVDAVQNPKTGEWWIDCADMSPHYTIELNEQGVLEFEFTRYSSFDMFIERSAHYVEFTGKGQATDYIDTSNTEALQMITKAKRNDALSDQFLELYEADTVMGTRVPGAEKWESIIAVKPGVVGPTESVYKPYIPPTTTRPPLKARLARVLGSKKRK